MEKHGKVKNYLIAAISIALLSVIICLSNLTDSYSAMKIIKEDFSFELRDVSDVVYSENTVIGLDPVIEKNKVKFKVSFAGEGDYYQFFFDIRNTSAKEGYIKDIKIEGLENEDNVRISIIGIEKDDIIESSRYIDNIKVVMECLDDKYDEEGFKQAILEDISIIVEIEEKE